MRKFLRSCLAVVAIGLQLVPSHASHCDSDTVIFSRADVAGVAKVGAVNVNHIACIAMPDGEVLDSRLLFPASSEITVRYGRDLGASVPSVTAVLNGLGFVNTSVMLTRRIDPTLGFASYDSAYLDIPAGQQTAGSITARVQHSAIPGGFDQVCYHTFDAFC